MTQHHQRVGLAHAAQDAGALRAGEPNLPAALGRLDDGALVLRATRALADGQPAARLQHRQRLGLRAGHQQQRLAREGVEGHQRRDRVAGQGEEEGRGAGLRRRTGGAPQGAEGKGPARPHGHLPERHLAHARQQVAGVVGVAHADAAAGHHRVGAGHGRFERGLQRGGVVGHQPQVQHLDAQAVQRGAQARAVAVVDAARGQRLAGRAQLVAGREQRHPQAAHHRDFGEAEGSQQAQVGRPQHPSGAQGGLPPGQVLAAAAAVFSRAQHAGLQAHGAAVHEAQFHRHDGVQARGHDAARHDADALAARRLRHLRRACEHGAGQGAQAGGAVGPQVGSVQRVAVHGGVVVGRHVDRRDRVGGQHAAQRPGQGHRLRAGDRAQGLQDGLSCGGHGQFRAAAEGGGTEFWHGDILPRPGCRPRKRCAYGQCRAACPEFAAGAPHLSPDRPRSRPRPFSCPWTPSPRACCWPLA